MTKLYDLLGTKNRKEQEARVENLLNFSQAPVFDLIIRFDARNGQISVDVIGGQLPIQVLYQLLDAARNWLQDQERQAMQQMPLGPQPPPPEPVPPDSQPDVQVASTDEDGVPEVPEIEDDQSY